MKAIFILWLVLPVGKEIPWREYKSAEYCAAGAATERAAMAAVEKKAKLSLGYKFICRSK